MESVCPVLSTLCKKIFAYAAVQGMLFLHAIISLFTRALQLLPQPQPVGLHGIVAQAL
jgi:hypothetical protein